MKVFIAGATGVLGRTVTEQLVAAGHAVTGLVRRSQDMGQLEARGARAVLGDLFDLETVLFATRGANAVIHLASACPPTLRSHNADWEASNRLWREGTRNIIHAALENQAQTYVQQSLAAVHGDGKGNWIKEETPLHNPPEISAVLQAEDLALEAYRSHGLPTVILRGATLYGAESPLTRQVMDSVKARRFRAPGSGRQYWHWLHVHDMAAAVVTAALTPAPGEVFLVADDWPFQAQEAPAFLAKKLAVPAPPRFPVAVPLPFGAASPLFPDFSTRYRNDKLKRMLGWALRYPTYHDGWAQIFAQLGIPFM